MPRYRFSLTIWIGCKINKIGFFNFLKYGAPTALISLLILFGWLLLSQSLSLRELAGCALIFAAVVGAQLPLGRLLRRPAGSGQE